MNPAEICDLQKWLDRGRSWRATRRLQHSVRQREKLSDKMDSAAEVGHRRAVRKISRLYLRSLCVAEAALAEENARSGQMLPSRDIEALARQVNCFEPGGHVREVRVPKEGKPGEYRTISMFGLVDRARQRIVSDVIRAWVLANELEPEQTMFAGGRDEAAARLLSSVEEAGPGARVLLADVRDCFPNLPDELLWQLPLPQRVIAAVVAASAYDEVGGERRSTGNSRGSCGPRSSQGLNSTIPRLSPHQRRRRRLSGVAQGAVHSV